MKCDELETEQWLNYGGEPMPCYPAKDVDAAIAELKEVYKDSVDVKVKIWERYKKAEDEIRKTQRALWLARAERAKEMCKRLLIQGFNPKWEKVERKCLAKAKEYE